MQAMSIVDLKKKSRAAQRTIGFGIVAISLSRAAQRTIGFGIVAISLSLVGCEVSPTAPPPPGPLPPGLGRQISLVSGNGQRGPVGEPLAEQLVVRVTDNSGTPLAGMIVFWRPTAGEIPGPPVSRDGQPGPGTALTTDAEGLSSATWILGSRPGRHVVEAITLFSNDRIVFVATAE